MANYDVLEDATIDEDEHKQSMQATTNNKKGNLAPKGVVPLDKIYDLQNCFQGSSNIETDSSTMMNKHINLGTYHDMKFISLSTCCTLQEWQVFVYLFK